MIIYYSDQAGKALIYIAVNFVQKTRSAFNAWPQTMFTFILFYWILTCIQQFQASENECRRYNAFGLSLIFPLPWEMEVNSNHDLLAHLLITWRELQRDQLT